MHRTTCYRPSLGLSRLCLFWKNEYIVDEVGDKNCIHEWKHGAFTSINIFLPETTFSFYEGLLIVSIILFILAIFLFFFGIRQSRKARRGGLGEESNAQRSRVVFM